MAVIINDLELVATAQQSDASQGDSAGEQSQALPAGQPIKPFEMTQILHQQMERHERIYSH